MPTIRIDDDVWRELKNRAEPLEDSPNDVLRRVFRLEDGAKPPDGGGRRVRRRRVSDGIFPREDFYLPILASVEELGGAARTDDVLQRVYPRIKRRLSSHDLMENQSGEPNWRNSARWAREEMVKECTPPLLSPSSPHGRWEITDAGRDWLRAHNRSSS